LISHLIFNVLKINTLQDIKCIVLFSLTKSASLVWVSEAKKKGVLNYDISLLEFGH